MESWYLWHIDTGYSKLYNPHGQQPLVGLSSNNLSKQFTSQHLVRMNFIVSLCVGGRMEFCHFRKTSATIHFKSKECTYPKPQALKTKFGTTNQCSSSGSTLLGLILTDRLCSQVGLPPHSNFCGLQMLSSSILFLTLPATNRCSNMLTCFHCYHLAAAFLSATINKAGSWWGEGIEARAWKNYFCDLQLPVWSLEDPGTAPKKSDTCRGSCVTGSYVSTVSTD